MYEKKIQSLARQISKLKEEKGKSPRYPQAIWDQIIELRPYFSLGDLAQQLDISPGNLHKRTFRPHSQGSLVRPPKLNKKAQSSPSTLVPVAPYGPTIPLSSTTTPVFEMEFPSGVKIRIYS